MEYYCRFWELWWGEAYVADFGTWGNLWHMVGSFLYGSNLFAIGDANLAQWPPHCWILWTGMTVCSFSRTSHWFCNCFFGFVVCTELPTLYQACLRVLMDNIDGRFSVHTWRVSGFLFPIRVLRLGHGLDALEKCSYNLTARKCKNVTNCWKQRKADCNVRQFCWTKQSCWVPCYSWIISAIIVIQFTYIRPCLPLRIFRWQVSESWAITSWCNYAIF